jgi:hypothetical protein
MRNFTKFNILSLCILALFLLSFRYDNRNENCFLHKNTSASLYFSSFSFPYKTVLSDVVKTGSSPILFHSHKYLQAESKLVKYKKKFKRTSHVFPGIRPPVKEVPPVVFNSSTPVYSKPYFLSQLQYFLFRLTPF